MPLSKFLQDDAMMPPDPDPKQSGGHWLRLWRVAGAFGRRDPSLFVAIFALWMMLTGLSLMSADNAFTKTPIYSVALDLGLNDNYVGVSMVLNALALVWGLGDLPPRIRASISLVSGVMWVFWSVILFFGGLKVGLYSASALWTFASSLALMRSTAVHITHQLTDFR